MSYSYFKYKGIEFVNLEASELAIKMASAPSLVAILKLSATALIMLSCWPWGYP